MPDHIRIALISDTFFGPSAEEELTECLIRAKQEGADLAVLPELALNPWAPCTKLPSDEDAEELGGKRTSTQARACSAAGIALVGAVLTRDMGKRLNTAVFFDSSGRIKGTYSKTHLPHEPGFWEASHYEPGDSYGVPFDLGGFAFGVQICSDANRPEGTHIYGAMGASAVLVPRSTELATYDRWRPVFIANAITSGVYVLSVNRPRPEGGVLIGGPSIAVSPRGEVIAETTERMVVVELDLSAVNNAKHQYPGYLAVRSDLYAEAWSRIPNAPALEYID